MTWLEPAGKLFSVKVNRSTAKKAVRSVINPVSSEVKAVTTLKIEPGEY